MFLTELPSPFTAKNTRENFEDEKVSKKFSPFFILGEKAANVKASTENRISPERVANSIDIDEKIFIVEDYGPVFIITFGVVAQHIFYNWLSMMVCTIFEAIQV